MNNRVLLLGLIPELVDFSAMPGMTADKVRSGLNDQEQVFRDRGFDPVFLLVDLGETAEQVVQAALEATSFDVVVIGNGIRSHPSYFLLFERLINLVHTMAPTAKIAFNTQPTDTLDAALRWMPAPGVAE